MSSGDLRDLFGEAQIDRAPGGEVHRDVKVVTFCAHSVCESHRLVDEVERERLDQLRRLDDRHEQTRRKDAPLRMRPAHERLAPGHPVRGKVKLGLVVEDELVSLHGAADVGGQAEPLRTVVIDAGAVGLDAGVGLLGRVHGHVGMAQERVGIVAVVGRAGDSDGGTDVDRDAVHLEGLVEQGHDVVRDKRGIRGVLKVRQEDGELVAAEAGRGV